MSTEKRQSIHQEFIDKLSNATGEDKQVNPAYVRALERQIPRIKTVGGGNTDLVNNEFSNLEKNNNNQEICCEINTLKDLYPNIETDGVFEVTCQGNGEYKTFLLQLECKLNVDFNDAKERAKVILQVCCYLKQIKYSQQKGAQTWKASAIPKVVVLGSKINCLALPTSILFEHADKAIQGYKSASTAHLNKDNASILSGIIDDIEIYNYSIVRNTEDKNCVRLLCEQILRLGNELKITDDLSEHTMSLAFDFFDMYVLDEKVSKKLSSREKVDIFIGTFFNEEFEEIKTNRHATSYDKLRIHGIEVKVDPDKYNQFKVLFAMRDYGKPEQKKITAITDRLLEDTDRRRKGDFYTPSIWVDEAHKLLDKNLGENWRDEYMVWDCAWGTGNLTRDYKFTDLYCSTLQKEDLSIGYRYNVDACKFQYDFLNDDIEEMEQISEYMIQSDRIRNTNPDMSRALTAKANETLKSLKLFRFTLTDECLNRLGIDKKDDKYIDTILNTKINDLKINDSKFFNSILGINGEPRKKLVFLINPPYKKAGAITSGESSGKISNEKSKLSTVYSTNSSQLYSQFLFRIMKIKYLFKVDTSIGIFCPSAIFSVDEHRDLLKEMYNENIRYTEGFIFKSSHFEGTGNDWPVAFSVFKNNDSVFKYDFDFRLLDLVGTRLDHIGDKNVYTVDKNKQLASWCKRNIKNAKRDAVPYLSNALGNEDRSIKYTKGGYKNIGGFWCHSNRVTDNNSRVSLWTAIPNQASGNPITEETFNDMISVFSARRLISGAHKTWLNDTDQYMIPDLDNEKYNQWLNDCIVLALFNSTSFQTSLRNVICQGKQWNIQNEFFWMSVKEIEKLAGGEYSTDDINTTIEDDIEAFGKERYVYKKLQEVTLSPDAQAVLDKATEIVKKSFKYRKQFNQIHPEYYINTWDAGWYQIKGMCKEYPELKKELDTFSTLYKALEDRMRPLVYELGFLYK